ncbi:MAG: flagellar export protein FliJ [candidate division KSB1 bacterium]|nr:flagellar export protein FliJ [candidate division KSB1 bacterium]MDZ7385517.1 flagellar export protein FliJ [candidate division KSB1 bacterium]MDZ7392624.1 flagellar export protein FliJ [candidate division KSB1 bacterium]
MKAFRFPLQRVLDARRHKEDARKKELAAAKQAELEAQERLRLLQDHSAEVRGELGCHVGRVFKASEMSLYYAYSQQLQHHIAQQEKVVTQAAAIVAEKREALLASSKEKKALEKLKERMKDRHLVETNREEQTMLDEAAARLGARKVSVS